MKISHLATGTQVEVETDSLIDGVLVTVPEATWYMNELTPLERVS